MSKRSQKPVSASPYQIKKEDDRAMTQSQPIERQIIQRNAFKTAIGLTVAFLVLYFIIPISVPPLPTLTDRLVYTLRFQSFSCLTLIAGIELVAITRFHTTAIDPINGRGEHHVAVAARYLTNTLEQFIVSFVGQMILATYLQEQQMKVIPILVLFFVFGRIAFYFGYKQSYLKRTVGFVATFGVSIILWVVIVYFVVLDLVSQFSP